MYISIVVGDIKLQTVYVNLPILIRWITTSFWTNPVGKIWSEIIAAQVSSIIAAFVAAKPAGFSNAEAALYASLGCFGGFLLVVFLLTSSQVVGFSWWLFWLVELVGEQKNNTRFCLAKKSLPILPLFGWTLGAEQFGIQRRFGKERTGWDLICRWS